MPIQREIKIYRTFLLSTTLAVALTMTAVFYALTARTSGLMREELLSHARAHFATIVKARTWNARYGGVYVEKKPGVESNPFLDSPDIHAIDGRTYTLRNPAIMTREISDLTGKGDTVTFRITSLKPLNPANSPDDFERTALSRFEKGADEYYRQEAVDGKAFFRYMAPLLVQRECLACHGKQGYRPGDVRGGIDISFNIDAAQQKLRSNYVLITASGLATTSLLLAAVWVFLRRLTGRLSEARRQIETMAITDSLTGLFNRRHLMERFTEEFLRARRSGRELCALLIDLDRFKAINDTRGHVTGDAVLAEASRRIAASVRMYDVVGRYGGEEFLVIVPDAGREEARELAERIRLMLRDRPIESLTVTASIGLAGMQAVDATSEDLLRRADGALYRAKELGRDRVEAEP